MQKINKRAVSNIVAVVSLILLTIVLISTLSYTFNKIIAVPQLAPAMSCLEMQTSFPLSIQKACFNSETNQTEITVKRKLDTEINSFDFSITTLAETSEWYAGPGCVSCGVLSEGQVKTYFLNQTIDVKEKNKAGISINNCLIQTKDINFC